jgi:hypothetical protein
MTLPHTLNSEVQFYYPSFLGALLAALGGALGAISIPRGVWWLERGSISLMVGAIGARIYSLGYQRLYEVMSFGEVAISILFLGSSVRLTLWGPVLAPEYKAAAAEVRL